MHFLRTYGVRQNILDFPLLAKNDIINNGLQCVVRIGCKKHYRKSLSSNETIRTQFHHNKKVANAFDDFKKIGQKWAEK